MKRLFLNGDVTDLFFNDSASYDDIFEWVQEQLLCGDNTFNLNEVRSCTANNHIDGGIAICGVEDYKIITIEKIVPILLEPKVSGTITKKIYKTKGLPYYVKGCNNIFEAVSELLKNKVGVTAADLEEVTTDLIPMGARIFCV